MARKRVKVSDVSDLSGLTFSKLGDLLASEKITEKELRKYYSYYRKRANEAIKRINKSDVPFAREEEPLFRPLKNLVLTSHLLHEIADLNKFLNSKQSTITSRKRSRNLAINTLRERGFNFVNTSNFFDFQQFMKWFKSTEYSMLFDSDSAVTESVFRRALEDDLSNPNQWQELFNEYLTSKRVAGKRIARSRRK